jgi:hypothetical protein
MSNQTTYPLSAMFILMAACAMVTALMGPVVRSVVSGNLGLGDVLVASVAGSAAIMVLGAVLGLYHHRPLRGFAWGLLVGGAFGAVIGPIALTPANSFVSILITSCAGAVMLVVAGTFIRRLSAPWR